MNSLDRAKYLHILSEKDGAWYEKLTFNGQESELWDFWRELGRPPWKDMSIDYLPKRGARLIASDDRTMEKLGLGDFNASLKEEMRKFAEECKDCENPGVDIRPKTLKCGTCGISMDYDHEKIELTLNTCDSLHEGKECKLAQNYDFIRKMESRQLDRAEKEKKLPVLLTHKRLGPSGMPPEIDEMLSNIRNAYPANEDKKASPQPVSFEVEVDSPIVIFINKKGKLEDRSFV